MDVVYRASELGGCTRFLIGKRMGYTEMPPPAKFQGYFDRGNAMEERLIELHGMAGEPIHRQQEVVEMIVSPSITVRGHIDGVITNYDERQYLWECKRVSVDVFNKFKDHGWDAKYDLLDKYKWQVSSYMLATGLELRFEVACEPADGVLEIWPLYQELPFYSELQIKTRILGIEAAAQAGELGETCDKKNYPCPLYYLPGHDEEKDDEDEVVSGLCLAIAEAKKDIEAATKRDKDLRRDLLKAMGERTRVRTEVATVSVQRSYKTITDKERMEADGFKLENYQTKVEGEEYVRVTPRKGAVKDDRDTDES